MTSPERLDLMDAAANEDASFPDDCGLEPRAAGRHAASTAAPRRALQPASEPTDMAGMSDTFSFDDVPRGPIAERRRTPDRRRRWRGGRRDTDWLNRPLDSLKRLGGRFPWWLDWLPGAGAADARVSGERST
jgi:hypothetical protein